MDDECVGLPADFDINDNITTLTQESTDAQPITDLALAQADVKEVDIP